MMWMEETERAKTWRIVEEIGEWTGERKGQGGRAKNNAEEGRQESGNEYNDER